MKPILIALSIAAGALVLLVVMFGPGALLGVGFGLLAGWPAVLLVLLTEHGPKARATTDDDEPAQTAVEYPADFVPRTRQVPAYMTTGIAARFYWIDPRQDGEQ